MWLYNNTKKIESFHHKATLVEPFFTDELDQYWYLKSRKSLHKSLISCAISRLNLEKIKMLLPYTPNIHPNMYVLQATQLLVRTSKKRKPNREKLYSIVQFFLENNSIDLNYRPNIFWPLPLAYTVYYNDKQLTKLLLLFGANPQERIQYDLHSPPIFDLERGEEPKGWLMTMYNEIDQKRCIKMTFT